MDDINYISYCLNINLYIENQFLRKYFASNNF